MPLIPLDDEPKKGGRLIPLDDNDQPISAEKKTDFWLGRAPLVAQTMTFGAADELAGAGGAIAAPFVGLSPQKGYELTKKGFEQEVEQYKQDYPKTAAMLSLAGGVASPINKILPAGAIASGALGGAITGASEAEGLQRIPSAIGGAIIGAGVGGTLKTAGKLAEPLWRFVTGKGLSVAKIIANKLGKDIDSAIANLQKESPETLLEQKENMLGLAKDVGRESPEAAKKIRTFLKERASGESARIEKEFEKLTPLNAYTLDDVINAEKAITAPLYEQAYQAPPLLSTNIVDLIENVLPKSVIDNAKQMARLQRRPFEASNGYSTETIDYISRSLADDFLKLKNSGNPEMANALRSARTELLDEADKLNPAFKKARASAKDYLEKINGFDEGKKFFNESPFNVQKTWSKLTQTEKDAALVGFKKQALDEINKISEGRMTMSLADKIIGSKNQKEVLQILFEGNKKGYNEFISALKSDVNVNDSFRQIYNRLYPSVQEAETMPAAAIPMSKTGALAELTGVRGIQQRLSGINEQNAPMLAEVLTNKDAALELLLRIKNQKNLPYEQTKQVVEYITARLPILAAQSVANSNKE